MNKKQIFGQLSPLIEEETAESVTQLVMDCFDAATCQEFLEFVKERKGVIDDNDDADNEEEELFYTKE